MDQYTISLIDDDDNVSIVNLDVHGCISHTDMIPGAQYTLRIQGMNTEMADNIDCPNDEVEIEFTAPDIKPTKFNSHPCLGVTQEPQFPIPLTLDDFGRVVNVTNTGAKRYFDIVHTSVSNGEVHILMSQIEIDENETIEVAIPEDIVKIGSNYFTTIVDGESTQFQYIVL